jgi:hypothetical protein
MSDLLQPWHLIVLFAIFMFPVTKVAGTVALWFVCKRVGLHPALSFLNLVPFGMGTVALLFVLAFSRWKTGPAPETW